MFRMRRYRVFLIFAVIAIGALYHFTSLGDLESAGAASVEGLKNFGSKVESSSPPPATKPVVKDSPEHKDLNAPIAIPSLVESGTVKKSQAPAVVKKPEASTKPSPVSKPSVKDDEEIINPKATPAGKPKLKSSTDPSSTNKTSKPQTGPADPVLDGGGGRLEIIADSGLPKIHWSQMPEHFPIPTESLIQLPTGKAKSIPKIQHEFAAESPDEKAAREEKRDIIRKAFSFSWAGYKKRAWMQDELSPVSGKYRNPFNGWGATLVDSLDTLYMMDLKDEFDEAVEAVKDIDFTTSPRNDIPLFETVIRYLGGLVAAYDISDGVHRILLDKAVELAEILMGAFDTPNRMPMTFYLWKPTFASQPHRAKTRVVLAELGSLLVEFTRLAQITKEAKYYDAVARITNELELWQNNTRMPGLWPNKVDASGCKKPDLSTQTAYDHTGMNGATNSKPLGIHDSEVAKNPKVMDSGSAKKAVGEEVETAPQSNLGISGDVPKDGSQKLADSANTASSEISTGDVEAGKTITQAAEVSPPVAPLSPAPPAADSKGAIGKREINEETGMHSHPGTTSMTPECEPQGLASPPFTSTEEFGISGGADSTYEYLPKEYMLLGGLEEKYRTIYEAAADTITRDLLFRAMIPEEKRHILHPGTGKISDREHGVKLTPEGSHLGCFAGGMYAVGAKIFGREGDMKIAKELTEGCVWAYEATTTGIMPDAYLAIPCPDPVDCLWNETYYYEKLDPFGGLREKNRLAQQQIVPDASQKMDVKETDSKTLLAEPGLVSSASEKIESEPAEIEAANINNQGVQTKAEQAPNQSVETKVIEPEQGKVDNNMFKSVEGTAEKPVAPVPEQSAEHPVSQLAGGASVEQPMSPAAGDVAPPKVLVKRQLGDIDETPAAPPTEPVKETPTVPPVSPVVGKATTDLPLAKIQQDNIPWSRTANGTKSASHPAPQAAAYNPPAIPTREEFVQARIHDERLPEGMTKVTGSKYLLRPEAIESVFIMYRATGDVYWREKGWKMFKAIEKHTSATYGASAISDVTSEKPVTVDEMESFWLAETLKYFYLLFSEPNFVSLDEYVLNTEAHTFKRPE